MKDYDDFKLEDLELHEFGYNPFFDYNNDGKHDYFELYMKHETLSKDEENTYTSISNDEDSGNVNAKIAKFFFGFVGVMALAVIPGGAAIAAFLIITCAVYAFINNEINK